MADGTLTHEDEQELGQALDEAIAAGRLNGNLKDAFCKAWGPVKGVLQWILTLPVSQKIKDAISEIIKWGDFIHKHVCPHWREEAVTE